MEKMFRMWLDEHETKYLATKEIEFQILKTEKSPNGILTFVEFGCMDNWQKANYALFRLDMFSEL